MTTPPVSRATTSDVRLHARRDADDMPATPHIIRHLSCATSAAKQCWLAFQFLPPEALSYFDASCWRHYYPARYALAQAHRRARASFVGVCHLMMR